MPERKALLRDINPEQNRARPPLPRNLEDLEVIEPYNLTLTGLEFLKYDSGHDNPNPLFIFITNESLRLERNAPYSFLFLQFCLFHLFSYSFLFSGVLGNYISFSSKLIYFISF